MIASGDRDSDYESTGESHGGKTMPLLTQLPMTIPMLLLTLLLKKLPKLKLMVIAPQRWKKVQKRQGRSVGAVCWLVLAPFLREECAALAS